MGNDIVDLHDSGTRGKSLDARFVRRVLTPGEIKNFYQAESRDIYLWAAWAAKETAYKALVKLDCRVPSWPGRYEAALEPGVSVAGAFEAAVKTPLDPAAVLLYINEDLVHCIGCIPACDCTGLIVRKVEEISGAGPPGDPDRESAAARLAAARRIAELMELSEADVEIRRHRGQRGYGPPKVYIKGSESDIDLSLSHHGRFAAFAFTCNA